LHHFALLRALIGISCVWMPSKVWQSPETVVRWHAFSGQLVYGYFTLRAVGSGIHR
jgi:DMSO reductase anchor subunit